MATNKQICSKCIYWNNKQAELEYSSFCGICTCYKWKFEVANKGDVKVLDRMNRADTYTHTITFESRGETIPIGKVSQSRYCLVTDEEFGCIHFKEK